MFDLFLYQNKAETIRVDKFEDLVFHSAIQGVLRESSSVVNPIITIEFIGTPDFNYVYIPEFMRYYYVTDIVSVGNKLWQISLHTDVLMSYKNGILASRAFIERSESYSNPMLIDKERVVETGIDIETLEVPNRVYAFPGENESLGEKFMYVMTGLGVTSTERNGG